jgi:hypothetical protein
LWWTTQCCDCKLAVRLLPVQPWSRDNVGSLQAREEVQGCGVSVKRCSAGWLRCCAHVFCGVHSGACATHAPPFQSLEITCMHMEGLSAALHIRACTHSFAVDSFDQRTCLGMVPRPACCSGQWLTQARLVVLVAPCCSDILHDTVWLYSPYLGR